MPKIEIRKVEIQGDMAFVPLTRGRVAVIDAADASLVGAFNWFAWPFSGKVYAVRGETKNGKRSQVLMHRVIMGTPDGMDTDHRDGDGLNNRRSNLRIATRSQNMHNKKMQGNNTSGYKGVHWHKGRRMWQANIKLNDKRKYLGSFNTREEASAAYWAAAQEMHLDFARLE